MVLYIIKIFSSRGRIKIKPGKPATCDPVMKNDNFIRKIEKDISDSPSFDVACEKVIASLKAFNHRYTWVGIYLLQGYTLVLKTYLGRPTPHNRISLDKGICGAAARENRTIIVPDVKSDLRYLACSVETQSEIVVPIRKEGEVIGEIDIDSDFPDAFDDEDRKLLEKVAELLALNYPFVI
jgi:GAF domain-containing protein